MRSSSCTSLMNDVKDAVGVTALPRYLKNDTGGIEVPTKKKKKKLINYNSLSLFIIPHSTESAGGAGLNLR